MSVAEATRDRVFRMYNGHCAYCGAKLRRSSVTVDHVHPKARGGTRTFKNTKPSCQFCNMFKACSNVQQFKKKILKEIRTKGKFETKVRKRYKIVNGNVVFYFETAEKNQIYRQNRMEELFKLIEKEIDNNDNSREDESF